MSVNVLPSFIHFKHATSLFKNKSIGSDSKRNNEYDLLSIFGARLALEKRVLRLLKIEYALINDKPIGLSRIIDIVQNFDSIEFHNDLDWKLIQKINKWLNHYIHRQIRPWPWAIYMIFKYLEIILENGVINKDGKKFYSFYFSTVVVDEQQLNIDLENVLANELNDVKIKWTHIREAVVFEDKNR